MQRAAVRPGWPAQRIWVLGIGFSVFSQFAIAAELGQPPICSAATAAQFPGICTVTSLGGVRNEVKVKLTAASASIDVGGYKVVTENYNGNYLTPVIEALPGDTVAAKLINSLPLKAHDGMPHADNPTNLHYFHGGIVTPNNSRPKPAELGDGDNVYVHLKSGNSFDFKVPIPEELDARVLESPVVGTIPYPLGLNWYHSHMHGISSNQVMGGMSGLLSVGEAKANVNALCQKDPNDPSKCSNDVKKQTDDLRKSTKVQYALLRDIPLTITKRPDEADGDPAEWDLRPAARDFDPRTALPCGVWKSDNSGLDFDEKLRLGFCQRDKDSALLFTVNGQRFPTIPVEGGQNLLLRLGNLSANIPYWLELRNEANGEVLKLTILSLDGVVPANPILPGQAQKPVVAVDYDDVLLMPATRAEIYVRNDVKSHDTPQTYILQAKKHTIGSDEWPAIRLAQIVLKPNAAANKVLVALNGLAATEAPQAAALPNAAAKKAAELPPGCVRDLKPGEFRRVTFLNSFVDPPDPNVDWTIRTEIVAPTGPVLKDQRDHEVVSAIGADDGFGGKPFDDYEKNGIVNWTYPDHVCIDINHEGSHQQLWVLVNGTGTLHNFHIHQMKFRLATKTELAEKYFIQPEGPSHGCNMVDGKCTSPDYNFYDEENVSPDQDPGGTRRWHDTIPMPPAEDKSPNNVYLVMSYDAEQQIGRFVFHCHILKHEDRGLMAPIEVVRTSDGTGTEVKPK